MNDATLDELIARAALAPSAAQAAAADSPVLGRGRYELLEEIMTTPIITDLDSADAGPPPPSPRSRFSRGQRLAAAIAVAAAFVAAVAVPALFLRGGDGVKVKDSYTAAARAAAAAGPRILIDDRGWVVVHVDLAGSGEGEIRFVQGSKDLQVNWRRAADYQSYYDDRLNVSTAQKVSALGQEGSLFTYDAEDHAVILPVQGTTFIELRGSGNDRAGFTALLGRLKQVSVDEWLAAMPASVVKPGDERATAEQMLQGVPLPPEFTYSALPTGDTKDYYQFGAVVTGNVTCTWLMIYESGRARGDEAQMSLVDEALGGSRDWPVLKKMDAEGDWPDVVWEYADAVHARGSVSGFEQALGCDEKLAG